MEKTIIKPAFIVVALMIFAAIFSALFILPQSLGLDEAQSLWQASHSVQGIFYVIAQDVHVPLYHLLLHFWQMLVGNSVPAARILSLIFYLATIPLVYTLGRVAFDKKTALFAAVIFSLSPFSNWYGGIIRMYSLLTLFTVINQIFFLLIYKGDPRRRKRYWIGFLISAVCGIYTHYFFFFVLAVQALFIVSYRKLFPPRWFRSFFLIALTLVIVFLPWLFYVHSVGGLGANTSPKLAPPTTIDIANTFSNFFFGFQTDAINTIILSLWPLITILLMLALQRNARVSPEAAYFIMSTLAPIFLAATLSNLVIPFYLSRYFIGIFPSACLAISWFFFLYPQSVSAAARIGLAGTMAVMLGLQIKTAGTISPIKEEYRAATDYVETRATARDIIAVSTPFTIYPIEYYYHGPAALITIPLWNQLNHGPIPAYNTSTLEASIATFSADHEYLWLILSYDQGYEKSLKIYFDTHFERVEMKMFSPDLGLYGYRLNYRNQTLSDVINTVSSSNANAP